MRRITRLVIVCAVIVAVFAPAASAAKTGGLPFKPTSVQGGQLPYTGIGLGSLALLGVLMVAGGLLVRRTATARAD